MDRVDSRFGEEWEREFEREAMIDDDTAASETLASGSPIHIANEDTPAGHVVCVHPDGREELVEFDWAEAARTLGA